MSFSSLSHTDIVGTSTGVLGIILAFVFYFRAKTEVLLRYAVVNPHCLISPSCNRYPEKITIEYDNHAIPELSTVIILFWNHGRKTLISGDIASSDPLSFKFTNKEGEIEVLEVRSTHPTRGALGIETAVSGNLINLGFEFIAHMDGFAIEVFYAGDANVRIECIGTVKGAPREKRRYEPDPLTGMYFYSRFFLVRALVSILGAALVSAISLAFLVGSLNHPLTNIAGLLFGTFWFFGSTFFLAFFLVDFRQQTVPRRIRNLAKVFEIAI